MRLELVIFRIINFIFLYLWMDDYHDIFFLNKSSLEDKVKIYLFLFVNLMAYK